MNTTLFVVNGPSMAGLGLGGEGYLSYSIATPTGEGMTTPLTFTRYRRVDDDGQLADDLIGRLRCRRRSPRAVTLHRRRPPGPGGGPTAGGLQVSERLG